MPVLDGYGATRMIRELPRPKAAAVPIIAITANAMPGDDRKCREAGMDDFMPKPYTLDQLRDALRRWLHLQEPTAAAEPPITRGVLDSVRQLDPRNERNLVAELLGAFITTTENGLRELEKAVSEGNLADVVRVAHALKSGAANIGALTLAEHFRQLERLARDQDLAGVTQRMPVVSQANVEAVAAAREQRTLELQQAATPAAARGGSA